MKTLAPWITLALLVFTCAASAATAPAGEPAAGAERGVIARVNGEPVYLEDLERRLQSLHEQVVPGERPDFEIDRLVERLIHDTLLAQEARSLGFAEEEAIAGKLRQLRRDLAVERLEREEVWSAAEPAEQEVRALFERNYRRVTLRVLTTYEMAEAEAALERLRGGADFAELAAEVSVDPYKLRGGRIEDIVRVDLQTEIAEIAFEAEPGALIGPVRTSIGWSVVRLESFEPADPERWEALKKEVADVVRYQRGRQRKAQLGRALREEHPVEVDAAVLATVEAVRQPDGRLLPEVADPRAVLATVGSQRITTGDLQKALAWRWKGIRNEEAARAALPLVLEELVEERLLVAEALARGLDRTPEVERSVAAYEKSLLVDHYLNDVLGGQIEISPEDMRAYYEQNLLSFHRPPRVHVSQITVEDQEEASRLAEQLKGGTDFAWLARRHSIDRFKEAGGERGWQYPMPETDELSAHLLEAEVGEVLGPLGVPGNWSVLRVNSKEDQGPYPFQEISGNVRSALFRARFQEYVGEVLETLRSRSEIVVNQEALDALAVTGHREMTEESAGHAGGHGGGH